MEAAALLERFRSPGKGSGLRARRRLRPGELLYRAEPFAYVVSKELLGGVCERCLQRNEHLHRCSQCKVAKYCGKSCQKEAWLDHKQECKCLKSIKPNFPPDSVRLAGRIVFKLLRQSVCISERLYSFSDLQSNTEQLSEEMKDGLRHLAHTLQLYLKAEIQDASHLPAAIDFFQIFTKLTISYIESLMPTSERQKQLMRQYCFECDCHLCQDHEKDAEKLAGEESAWKEVKDAVNEVRYPKSKEEWEQVLARCQSLLSGDTGRLPDTNIYKLKMLDCAMDACINLEAWEQALCYGNRTLGPYRLYYPGFHPLRAVQLMRVGKLQYSQDMFPQALETLKEAYNIMKVTHGTDHRLMQTLMDLKEQCEAIMKIQ
ncbi:histone-lysine N-methyltransferase SMYD3 isoform X5 [Anas platyrhynchos]|uniref:histone-lysine N-methyltransferase SMYD3 isoform X5 n=1 Tax=Anas platyrhynchos TaxID=8839 RepID=UPI003AF21C09